jgi:hypothetical protein
VESTGVTKAIERILDALRICNERLTANREADSIAFSPRRAAVSHHILHEFMTGQTPEPLAKYDRMIWRLLTTAVPVIVICGLASWFI